MTVADFEAGEKVKVAAVSIGKGFQGTIKRHNFSRGPGHPRLPQRPGPRLGRRQRRPRPDLPRAEDARAAWAAAAAPSAAPPSTSVDAERNLLLVKGSVPGGRNATVEVRSDG